MTILQHLTKEAELSKEDKYVIGKALRGAGVGSLAGATAGSLYSHRPGRGAALGGAIGALLLGGKALYKKNKQEKEEEDKKKKK